MFSMDMDCDDVFGYLPPLKTDVDLKDDEFESGWYSNFLDEVGEDLDPKKLHELVVDYLICSGYKEPAALLCADAEIEFPTKDQAQSIDTLEQRDTIRNYIVTGNISEAINEINKLAPKLLAENTKLHFKLLRQQLVELIRNKETERVLTFAQENLMDKYKDQPTELFNKLEQTYALLAFDNPENSPFGYLMSLNQRNMLAYEVNATILAVLDKNPVSKLEHLLRMMVWNQHQHKTKGDERPLNSDVASVIARGLFAGDDDPVSSELL